jgi:hypothetical protein
MLGKSLTTMVASLAIFSATAAHASSAQSLSLSNAPARAATAAGDSNELAGAGAGAYVIGAIVAGLAIWGIVEIASDDDEPDSP